jgi:hypothetical protein
MAAKVPKIVKLLFATRREWQGEERRYEAVG